MMQSLLNPSFSTGCRSARLSTLHTPDSSLPLRGSRCRESRQLFVVHGLAANARELEERISRQQQEQGRWAHQDVYQGEGGIRLGMQMNRWCECLHRQCVHMHVFLQP